MKGDSDRTLAGALVGLARTLGADFSVQEILDHLVVQIAAILPVTGAGVMVMGDGDDLHFIAASDEAITALEVLQNELHQGPCVEAYRTGDPVEVIDMANDRRFTVFSARAAAAGLAAVFTFPMHLDGIRLGAVDLYRDTPGPLAADDTAAAQTLTDVAAAFLINARTRLDTAAAVTDAQHRLLHDPLTGLANQVLLEERLTRVVARARRTHAAAAVLFVDLDRFKTVNDHHGHATGDRVLQQVAARLTAAVRPGDTVARLGGDEFVIVCEDLSDPADAVTVAARVTTALAVPFPVVAGGEGARAEVTVGASVGVAFTGPGQDLPDRLLRAADAAMYQAKTAGGGRHRVVDPTAHIAVDHLDALTADLRSARDDNQLWVAYQPILDLASPRLIGVEALLRWNHPTRGLVPPAETIPVTERTGLIGSVGEWVLHQACTDLRHWTRTGLGVATAAVHISAQQVMDPAFTATVHRILSDTAVDPAAVTLEVTESVLLADAHRALRALCELKELGVGLALDDFGTGYASMNYLRRFPFDVVKIDRSFTADVPTDHATRAIVAAMIDLSHTLGLTVTVEGVETQVELDALTDLGADHAQGHLFARPLAARDLTDFAASYPTPPSRGPGPNSSPPTRCAPSPPTTTDDAGQRLRHA